MSPAAPPVLVVASWYPSVVDPAAGRFVRDGVAALAAGGRAAPTVVTFDPADLIGSGPVRARVADAVARHVAKAMARRAPIFLPSADPGVRMTRLAVASGRYGAAGPTHAAVARARALATLADRWLARIEDVVPRPALVHAHTVYPDGVAAAVLADRLAVPLILTEHTSAVARLVEVPEVRAAYLDAVARSARLLVVSRVLADELAALLPAIGPRIEVVPNGIDLREFGPARSADRRPGELLFVGYRKATKGIGTLLDAFARVAARRPEATLRLIGGAPSAAAEAGWRSQAERLGLAGRVAFEGPAERPAVAAAMARASLFVHPSPRETFGVVAVEALASGLPVVATDSGGVTEILGDPGDGLGVVVPAGDADALADGIVEALGRIDDVDRERLRASVAARFAAERVAERVAAVYAAAIDESAAGRGGLATAAAAPGGRDGAAAAAPGDDAAPEAATAPRDPAAAAPGVGPAARLVVALDPARATAASGLVAAARPAVPTVLVTTAEWTGDATAWSGVVRAEPSLRVRGLADAAVLRPGSGRLARAIGVARHPLALARRRGWLPGLEAAVTTIGTAAVRDGIRAVGSPRPELVALDGVDHLAADSALGAGEAIPAPGGLRWLGDRLERRS